MLVLPGYPTAHEAELRERARALAAWTGRALPGVGLRPRSSRACGRSRRRSCSRRCTRASGCRCSRRWRAACRWRARTPPRCPRSPATRRCCSIPATSRRSPRRFAGCLTTPVLCEQLRARGLARVTEFTGERTARLTLDSYRAGRALLNPRSSRAPAPGRTPATAQRHARQTSGPCSRATLSPPRARARSLAPPPRGRHWRRPPR